MRRATRRVLLCDEIVDLGGGRAYVCGRHTKNKTGKCSQHNRPAAVTVKVAQKERCVW